MDRSKFDEMMKKSVEADKSEESSGSIKLNVADVHKINLSSGDTLAVTIKSDEIDQSNLDILKVELKKLFPNNKVFILGMRPNDGVEFSVVSSQEVGYCSDCSCGKKEQALADQENG